MFQHIVIVSCLASYLIYVHGHVYNRLVTVAIPNKKEKKAKFILLPTVILAREERKL